MKTQATPPQVQAIENELKADPQVKSYKHLDPAGRVRHLQEGLLRPARRSSSRRSPPTCPNRSGSSPSAPSSPRRWPSSTRVSQNVATVITAAQQIKRLLTATRWIRLAFISMASVLLASSLFLIVNTIRLATFARRREIEVMKLVGASNWFVRVPFMAEGLVQGAIGAGFAFGLVWALKIIISNLLSNQRTLLSTFRVTSSDALGIGLLVLLIGAGIGVIGSIVGLRRFLDA